MSDPMAWIVDEEDRSAAEEERDSTPIPTSVYRFFNADGALLYVGVTYRTYRRLGEHALSKTWWDEVATATFVHYPSVSDALYAEAVAIRDENPRYNIARPNPDNWDDTIVPAPPPFVRLPHLRIPAGDTLRGTMLDEDELLERIGRFTKRLYKMTAEQFIEAWQTDKIDRTDERLASFANLLGAVLLKTSDA